MKNKKKNLMIVLILGSFLGCTYHVGDVREVCDSSHYDIVPYYDAATETTQFMYIYVCDKRHEEICLETDRNDCSKWKKLDKNITHVYSRRK